MDSRGEPIPEASPVRSENQRPSTSIDGAAGSPLAAAALTQLWSAAGLDAAALARVVLAPARLGLPSSFAVGAAAQASIAAAGLAAAEIWRHRAGVEQTVHVDAAHACAEFRSERYVRIDGEAAPELWDRIAGAYRCGDGGWVRLHTNFPHHRDGVLALLGCRYDRDAVGTALRDWSALAFEQSAAERGLVVAAMRSFADWDRHAQAIALAGLPVLTIERIGAAPPQPLPALDGLAPRPLAGIRALDVSRVIAGPVCGRTLAAHGADVMLVTAPHLPAVDALTVDTGRGKRACQVDLRDPAGQATMRALVAGADIVVQAYRPGGLAARGFGAEDCAALRPGIVYVSLSAYGHVGPWAGRRGFDSLVQTATGFNHAEAEAAGDGAPRPLPAQALDHASAYLLALGAMAALLRRATEGGSWHVRVSLAQTGRWLRELGRVDGGLALPEIDDATVAALRETTLADAGAVSAITHAARLSATPARWERPPVALDHDAPAWD